MVAIVAELLILAVLLVKQKRGLRTAIGLGIFLVSRGSVCSSGSAEPNSASASPPYWDRRTPNFPATFACTSTTTGFACS